MLANPVEKPFDHPDWIFEVKWDGYRAVAEIRDRAVSLYSRNGISFNKKFSPIVESLRKFGFDAVLDGEIVVVDKQGRSDFQMLQHYQDSGGHLLYYVFDLLYFQGHDLTGLPLVRRKEVLKKILPSSPKIRFSDHVVKEGVLFYQVSKEKGLEGIIAGAGAAAHLAGAMAAGALDNLRRGRKMDEAVGQVLARPAVDARGDRRRGLRRIQRPAPARPTGRAGQNRP